MVLLLLAFNKFKTLFKNSIAKILLALICASCIILIASCKPISKENKFSSSMEPKDKYGLNYIIGNLGGKPVNLPGSVVELVEYDDSPGWDVEKSKTYNPPPRTYDSIIESFGFDMRYTDGLIREVYHKAPPYSNEAFHAEYNLADSPWIRIRVGAGKSYEAGLKNSLKYILKVYPETLPFNTYKRLPETFYGLQIYAPLGIDPKTGVAWRKHKDAKDIYVYQDNKGETMTIIRCSNRKVYKQTCSQTFNLEPEMKVTISVVYVRGRLKDWQKIQEMASKAVKGFIVNSPNNQSTTKN